MRSFLEKAIPSPEVDLTSRPILSRTTLYTGVFQGTTYFVASSILLIIAYILSQGPRGLSPHFLLTRAGGTHNEGMFDVHNSGVFDMVVGTVMLVFLMTIFVMPIGIVTGIYLNEFVDPRSRRARIIGASINNLAGIPSIIFGLFGLGLFVLTIGRFIDLQVLHSAEPLWGKPSLIWAALTLAILTLPVVVVSTEQALRSVSSSVRDASLAMGATRLQMLRGIVLPQAYPGILTGGILAISRGAGEVAPIMFTGAVYYMKDLPHSIHDPFMELGYHVYNLSTQSVNTDDVRPLLFSTVVTLLLVTFFLNLSAVLARARLRHKQENSHSN